MPTLELEFSTPGFYDAPTDDANEEAILSRKRCLRGIPWPGSIFLPEICQDRFIGGKFRPWQENSVKNKSPDMSLTYLFRAEFPNEDQISRPDLTAVHYASASAQLLGDSGTPQSPLKVSQIPAGRNQKVWDPRSHRFQCRPEAAWIFNIRSQWQTLKFLFFVIRIGIPGGRKYMPWFHS